VSRLDRLAGSTRDLLNILDAIGKAGAAFKSLADAWADTTTPHDRLMLTALGGLAEFRAELIFARTSERQAPRQGPWRQVRPSADSSAPRLPSGLRRALRRPISRAPTASARHHQSVSTRALSSKARQAPRREALSLRQPNNTTTQLNILICT
jgi:DNA invertase Pin-like site-specific DNA recombinase